MRFKIRCPMYPDDRGGTPRVQHGNAARLWTLRGLLALVTVLAGALAGAQDRGDRTLRQGLPASLKAIFDEVKDMGPYPGQNYIKQEFFIGGPDDDDTNKDVHVVVLIQTFGGSETLTLQLTYLERTRWDPNVKIAKETKSLAFGLDGGALRLLRSDYAEAEIPKLAAEILKAIKDKKRLLKK